VDRIKRERESSSSTTSSSSAAATATVNDRSVMSMMMTTTTTNNSQPQNNTPSSIVDGFAWDVNAEEALEDIPPQEQQPQQHNQTIQRQMFTSIPMSSTYHPNPLPLPGASSAGVVPASSSASSYHMKKPYSMMMTMMNMPQPQQQQQCQPRSSLDNDDINFFRTLFQPTGDVSSEKEILDSFFLDHPGVTPSAHFPPSSSQVPIAPCPSNAGVTALPFVTSGAVSEYNFPRKLYRLLEDCESNPEYQSIVSWSMDGNSFKVHCKKRFVAVILPNYFDQTQYASFRRQLNMYSFARQSMSTYSNPFFVRGRRELLDHVVRKSGNTNPKKQKTNK
jgi:hypothetical protein